MDKTFNEKIEDAVWVGKKLFDRGLVTGSTGNLSFRHNDAFYITASGSCFGRLDSHSFTKVSFDGECIGEKKPSKEYPLHKILYQKSETIQAVIHTHSFYSTLWSCLKHSDPINVIPNHTPYLKMKVGTIGLIPYAEPGSKELFQLFSKGVDLSDGYLLQNHGPVVSASNLMEAFYSLEELEESSKIAWHLRAAQM